ncbi:MAG: GNAT family N-acetyltransferase [Bacteroidaceae bacterium]|nr:GNAT family N-acetyltransferase [Bacteroidaceae bacterium]
MNKTVYFRAFEPDDVKLIHQWKNSDELNELTVGLNKKTSMEDDQQWVNNHKDHHPYYAYWAICDCNTDRMIGYASLVNIHYINSSAETGAILIGDPNFNDGFAWIETVLFLFEYAFERLNLNRVYGQSIIGHKISNLVEPLMFMKQEGVLRQAAYKNGHYYDISFAGILRSEYFSHKEAGDYEMAAILRRIKKLRNK